MCCQMESTPLLHSSSQVDIELLQLFLLQLGVQEDYSLYALLLSFASSCVQRRPVINIPAVHIGSIGHEGLCDVVALLGVLGEDVHD